MFKIIEALRSRLCKVEWHVAVRKRNGNRLLFVDEKASFNPIKNTLRYWAADPFLVSYNKRTLLFVELYDRLKRKGLIGYMDITDGIKNRFKRVFEYSCHLSYPHVFLKDNELYCVPESNRSNQLLLLKWDEKKEEFAIKDVLMDGIQLADTTFLNYGERQYLLTTPIVNRDNISHLDIYEIKNGQYIPSLHNPIIWDKTKARNGGKTFEYKGDIYRVSQDCGNGYGSGLNILKIERASLDDYKESMVKKIKCYDVSVSGCHKIDGIHTYNFNDFYEVIDYKIDKSFSIVECVGYLLGLIGLFKK